MRIRGSLHITKSLYLPNPNGSSPAEGRFALSDATGSVKWGDLLIPILDQNAVYDKGSIVLHDEKLWFAKLDNANGSLPLDIAYWVEVGQSGTGGSTLPQNQIDALDAASAPSGANPYATIADINNLILQGSTGIADILSNNATVPNQLWISTDDGVDSYSTPVVAGDGLVSNGSGWYTIGQFRGPIGQQGEQGIQGPAGGGITMQGSDTVANILLKDDSTPGLMWIAVDTGVDDDGTAVAIGDGLVSTGTKWITVGAIRGPQGPQGDPGPGLPIGGSVGAKIRKTAGGDYATEWYTSQYTHIQTGGAAIQWDIAHNLGEIPLVQILDTNDVLIEGEIEHIDLNNTRITFNVALEGIAYLKI